MPIGAILNCTMNRNNIIDSWFGGGTDLTPYYLFEEDARHFHQTLKEAIDPFGSRSLFPLTKKIAMNIFPIHIAIMKCGESVVYFTIISAPADEEDAEKLFKFQQANGNAFLKAYLPIVEQKKKYLLWRTGNRMAGNPTRPLCRI